MSVPLSARMKSLTRVLAFALLGGAAWAQSGSDDQLSARIDNYLKTRSIDKKPLVGLGSDFVARGRQFDVDPRLVVAMSGAESSFGAHICTANNAWNWFWEGPCPNSPFDNWSSGINTVTKYLHKSYIIKGYNTIPLIGARYCAAGCEHWVPNVTQFFQQLGGDTAHLDWPGNMVRAQLSMMTITPTPSPRPATTTQETPAAAPDVTIRVADLNLPRMSWRGKRSGPATFTVDALISGDNLIPGSVRLLRVLPQSRSEVAKLEDTGTDENGKQVFAAAAAIDDPQAEQVDLQVSAQFRRTGSTRVIKLLSNKVTVRLSGAGAVWVPLALGGIGVVIILALVAFLVWRMIGKRRRQPMAANAG